MAKRDFHDLDAQGGPRLLTLGGEVQQPGVIVANEGMQEQNVYHDQLPLGAYIADIASDKFAVLSHWVDAAMAYQLLPVDPQRKRALLLVPSTQVNYSGVQQTGSLVVPSPALGAEIVFTPASLGITVPVTLASISFTFATSATAGNRVITLNINGVLYRFVNVQTASGTTTYYATVGGPSVSSGNNSAISINPTLISPNTVIQTQTANKDAAGDQFANVRFTYQLTNPTPTVLVGGQSNIDASLSGNPLGFPIVSGVAPVLFTSKQSLWACSLSGAGAVQIVTLVERFQKGTPVT